MCLLDNIFRCGARLVRSNSAKVLLVADTMMLLLAPLTTRWMGWQVVL